MNQLKYHWPDEFESLDQGFSSCLPSGITNPVHPHTGFVINLNVICSGHLDVSDGGSCVILPCGENIEGAELVLEQTGQIIRMRVLDAITIRSSELVHYNLDLKGIRMSIVIQTDGHGKQWVECHNHWGGHLRIQAGSK